jgi:hypothetical protein
MALTAHEAGVLDRMSPEAQRTGLGTELLRVGALADAAGSGGESTPAPAQEFFAKTVLVAPALADDGVVIVAADAIPDGKAIHVLWFLAMLSGATAWGSVTDLLYLKGIGETGTELAIIPSDKCVANAVTTPETADVSIGAAMKTNTGLPVGQGLEIRSFETFTAGSSLALTVFGYFA